MSGMGSHQSAKAIKDEWLTPPEIIKALGCFDLDPCAPVSRPWDTAKHHFTIEDDGLSKEWFGRVWLNPPYGKQTGIWLDRLVNHGNGIALIFARTETRMFFDYVWSKADEILFLKGRLFFHHSNGQKAKFSGGAPSCLIAYGGGNVRSLRTSGLEGKYINIEEKAASKIDKIF